VSDDRWDWRSEALDLREKIAGYRRASVEFERRWRDLVILDQKRQAEVRELLASAYRDPAGEVARQVERIAQSRASEERLAARLAEMTARYASTVEQMVADSRAIGCERPGHPNFRDPPRPGAISRDRVVVLPDGRYRAAHWLWRAGDDAPEWCVSTWTGPLSHGETPATLAEDVCVASRAECEALLAEGEPL